LGLDYIIPLGTVFNIEATVSMSCLCAIVPPPIPLLDFKM
jgi:hypothetical protein